MDIHRLSAEKKNIVPVLFTEHQFQLIQKKFSKKVLSASERNEFSRVVSRKMCAVYALVGKEYASIFVSGAEKIIPERLVVAKKYLSDFSRKFKGHHMFITGSFLYSKKYNDIDVFVVGILEKDDQFVDGFHITFLTEDVYNSLFFASVKKMCVSNREMESFELKEKVNLDKFISLYQELFNDLENNFEGVKKIMREFLLQSSFLAHDSLPTSFDLRTQIDSLLSTKNPKEAVKKIFVRAIILGIQPAHALRVMKHMISLYKNMIQQYAKYKNYYKDLMSAFEEVISVES